MKNALRKQIRLARKCLKRNVISITDSIDLAKSSSLNISDCNTVCLALGPYRNLTTLTAATLFLHPNCQVLNHAGDRIYNHPKLNFWSDFSEESFDRFIKFAITISSKGGRGDTGGSIIHSHAFDTGHKMKEIFEQSNPSLKKHDIRCLFWKESLRTSNQIRQMNLDLQDILKKENRLRFLLPIRNPLDCAHSNLKTGHVRFFQGLHRNAAMDETLSAVLREIRWFAELQNHFPNRFFHFFEHDLSGAMLVNLANFLNLKPDQNWLSSARAVMVTKSGYTHENQLIRFYRATVKDLFSGFPQFREGLLTFASMC